MEKYKFLSGVEIVAKGATKIEVTLPELGLKDVTPDGSWLEQKQIQSALEARKRLVEVQRIDKSGVLSHAEWRDDLNLAEVTQLCGGHWQYLGHHREKKVYLRPEEALYLMEVNCLLLKYCGVTVSLQQAYSLLLSNDNSISQYKVYASLSRLGYKVFRHVIKPKESEENPKDSKDKPKEVDTEKSDNSASQSEAETQNDKIQENEPNPIEETVVSTETEKHNDESEISNNGMDVDAQNNLESNENKQINSKEDVVKEVSCENSSKETNGDTTSGLVMDVDNTNEKTTDNSDLLSSNTCLPDQCQDPVNASNDNIISVSNTSSPTNKNKVNMDPLRRYCQWKLQKLKSRQDKSHKNIDENQNFGNCPDLLRNQVVSMRVPSEEYIPKNIFLNNLCYVLNLENIRKKNNTAVSTTSAYSLPDEVNGAHIRRVTDSAVYNRNPQTRSSSLPHFYQNFRPNMNQFRHFGYYRPRTNTHYFQFNLFYQRPFMGNFNPRFQFYPRMHMPMFPGHTTNSPNVIHNTDISNSAQWRQNTPRYLHFAAIKNLALRLRQLAFARSMRQENIQALQRIINTYNERYRAHLRLTEEYEVVNDETIVDTIELDDDDEESRAKRPRLTESTDVFNENLNKIRQIARKLKSLDEQNKTSARHRRALSGLIKTFNKSFNADIYLNDNFEVLDRRQINLDSDSDSDCVVEVSPVVPGKKLRNPFNILKRLSEKNFASANSSRWESVGSPSHSESGDLHENLEKIFKKSWLPPENDFGRPEVTPRDTMNARIIETKKEEYLFDFYKNQSFNNWVDIKIAFLENIEDTNAILHTEAMMDTNNEEVKSLVTSEDCTDMSAVLKKLRIIKCNKDTSEESTLKIDFDVYNRDVQNFRKADRPTPHFRIVCLEEATARLNGKDIATLHSKYEDNVTILFAVIGTSSISLLQMNPSDLPVYAPCSE